MNADRELAAARERIYADIDARIAEMTAGLEELIRLANRAIKKLDEANRRSFGQQRRRFRERTAR